MAMKIAVIGGKGGTGKSGTARTIAARLVSQALSVRGFDMDGDQASFYYWSAERAELHPKLPRIPVDILRDVKQIARNMKEWDYGAFVVDGGAYVSADSVPIARAVDMIVMPTGHSKDDIAAVVRIADQLEKKGIDRKKICVVFMKVSDSKRQDAQCRQYLEENGLFVAAGHIPQKDSYFEAMDEGLSLCEVKNAPRLFTCARITFDSILEYGHKLMESQ